MSQYGPRAYQGYPYVNPIATEAPSLTPDQVAAMARWANLPKRGVGGVKGATGSKPSASTQTKTESSKEDDVPVVYIDIPETNGSPVTRKVETHSQNFSKKDDIEDTPVVYIDIPDENGSEVSQHRAEDEEESDLEQSERTPSSSSKEEDPPVVYIDLPEQNGSGVSQSRVVEPSFVQETIFYDPFKNRRIDAGTSGSHQNGETSRPPRPPPPSSLNVPTPGTSGYGSNDTVPPFLSKESYIYRQPSPDDSFRLPPLSVQGVQDFPPPPPAYQEIDPHANQAAQSPGNTITQPPRTQVIIPGTPTSPGVPNPHRKYITCQFCSHRVHTLVIRESGIVTHALACVCLFSCFPLVPLIYCTSFCKHQNHYCPNCNHLVAYETPLVCTDVTYTTNSTTRLAH